MNYRIYMDVCCLNRPFDDLEQERIRLEAEAILWILQQCQDDKWSLVTSNTLEFELEKNPDQETAEQVALCWHWLKLGLTLVRCSKPGQKH